VLNPPQDCCTRYQEVTRRVITEPVILVGETVRLEPLQPEHVPALFEIARAHPEEFALTSTPTTEAQRDRYFQRVFDERDAGLAYPFVMLEPHSQAVIGTTRYADIRWQHRNCELGFTWFDPRYFGTAVNTESKLLMLTHLFESLQFLRVQINTDVRNLRSQRAIEALGATFEGILRRNQVTKDGHIRDTKVYSIIDSEWPSIKANLLARLTHKRQRSALLTDA
jgi:RimJ/RimL family protein N-acetyltransferase